MSTDLHLHESATLRQLIDGLASNDPLIRKRCRQTLVETHTQEVVAALMAELQDNRPHVRWEAAKALAEIGDPSAAPAFIRALDDERSGIRWLAAEGLIALKQAGMIALLHALTIESRSIRFYRAAHHVLHELAPRGFQEVLMPVLAALCGFEPAVAVPPAAYRALGSIAH